ncbi:ATP-binding protein [Alkalithermobacter paradoxus]|uniref:Transposase/IS protein n=1 Tax=Alkalithermobacter paradoxus TaxID=29349 RepID=A0A1V4I9Z0_9FIRM|nr:transposase/IS protein [[Clostridium] thermoalcaliphilum]
MSSYTKLLNNLESLKLERFRTFLPNYLNEVAKREIPFTDALLELVGKELDFRNERASKIQIAVSTFPYNKTLSDFDFQPYINKSRLLDLESLRFMENKENVLFLDLLGLIKNSLSCALGIAAAKKRYINYFISCNDLIMQLNKAHAENHL